MNKNSFKDESVKINRRGPSGNGKRRNGIKTRRGPRLWKQQGDRHTWLSAHGVRRHKHLGCHEKWPFHVQPLIADRRIEAVDLPAVSEALLPLMWQQCLFLTRPSQHQTEPHSSQVRTRFQLLHRFITPLSDALTTKGGALYLGGTLVTQWTTKVEWHVFIGSLSESTSTTFVSPLFWTDHLDLRGISFYLLLLTYSCSAWWKARHGQEVTWARARGT